MPQDDINISILSKP